MSEIKIGNRTFKCEPLPATEALALAGRFMKFVAPVIPMLGVIAEEEGESLSLKGVQVDAEFWDKLSGTIIAYDFGATIALASDLARTCRVDNEPVVVDANLQDPGELIEVASWAATVQFESFFRGGALGRAGARIMRLMPQT
ncbi:hypothetical protein FHT98_0627 [Bosea sp. AK1]|uniref:phage tail assembly chaperone n=1 Tax=Bosea sp. AK1 TaxID=2587160 RepID=UPI00114ECC64|nr:hypothetical protein [Bosea sp. AK1]TQI72907.1 hypothetical protein FHT98_0627 [Bosea sp. AK1]